MTLIKKIRLAFAVLAISHAYAVGAAIDNASFEDGFDGWSDTDPSAVSGDSYTGSSSAKITGSGGRVDQQIDLVAFTDYTLTAYVKGSGEVGVNLGSSTESAKSTSNSWTQVTVEFNSGSATSAELFAKYYNGEGRFDDFALESSGEISAPEFGETFDVPGIIQAEDYNYAYDISSGNTGGEYRDDFDVDIQITEDDGGGYNVGWIKAGESLEYSIDVTDGGIYTLEARVASEKSTGQFEVQVNGSNKGSISVDNTSDWQQWDSKSLDLGNLSEGEQTLRISVTGSDFNINWFKISETDDTPPATPTPTPTPTIPRTGDCYDMDLRFWGVTFPDGESLNDAEHIQKYLLNQEPREIDGEEKGWLTWDEGCPTFVAPPNDDTDSDVGSSESSDFARSELRELLTMYFNDTPDDTDIENQWVTSEASNSNQTNAGGVNGNLKATLIVNSVTESGSSAEQEGRIIVGQIHGVDDEPVKIYYQKVADQEKGSVYITVDGSNGDPSDRITFFGYNDKITSDSRRDQFEPTEDGIALGQEWSYEIDLTGDQLRVTISHSGKTFTTADAIAYSKEYMSKSSSGSGVAYVQRVSSDTDAITISSAFDNDLMYFKAGVYNQNNKGDGDDVASVTFKSLVQSHD